MNTELVNELINTLRNTKEFVASQAPDVLRQLVQWEIESSCFWIASGALVIVFAALCLKNAKRLGEDSDEHLAFIGSCMGVMFFSLAGGFMILGNVSDLLCVLTTPKVFLLERLSHMVR